MNLFIQQACDKLLKIFFFYPEKKFTQQEYINNNYVLPDTRTKVNTLKLKTVVFNVMIFHNGKELLTKQIHSASLKNNFC